MQPNRFGYNLGCWQFKRNNFKQQYFNIFQNVQLRGRYRGKLIVSNYMIFKINNTLNIFGT